MCILLFTFYLICNKDRWLIAHDMTLTEGESGGGHIDVKRGTLSMDAPLIAKNSGEKKLSPLEILQNYMTPLGNSKVKN